MKLVQRCIAIDEKPAPNKRLDILELDAKGVGLHGGISRHPSSLFPLYRRRTDASPWPLSQRFDQRTQVVMVQLVHERKQPSELSLWEPFPREPGKVMPRQVSNEPALVLSEGHLASHEQLQQLRGHSASSSFMKFRLRFHSSRISASSSPNMPNCLCATRSARIFLTMAKASP